MIDVSIEYAHIYTNSKIDVEHQTSVDLLSKLEVRLKREGKSHSLVVLVDDYSFPDPTFDYGYYVGWLADQGYKPDLLIRESELVPVCDEVLKLIVNTKLHAKLVDYIRDKKKYPCSLFIATWYLMRLGYLQNTIFDPKLTASLLVNILPASFKPFEDQGLEIIAATKHTNAVKQIEYEFIDGRLIA